MFNITLVSTRHDALGMCNNDELYKIIKLINPDVIFEEIPPTHFDDFYVDNKRSSLETDTICKYIKTHPIEHVPVDSEDVPPDEFFEDYEYLTQKIESLGDINGFDYRNLVDRNRSYIESDGFEYLSSIDSINRNSGINKAIEKGLKKIDEEKLYQIFKNWNEFNDMRETIMLQNIYSYSKAHNYERAIFTVGSAHRKSIIEKTVVFQKKEEVKLNWIF